MNTNQQCGQYQVKEWYPSILVDPEIYENEKQKQIFSPGQWPGLAWSRDRCSWSPPPGCWSQTTSSNTLWDLNLHRSLSLSLIWKYILKLRKLSDIPPSSWGQSWPPWPGPSRRAQLPPSSLYLESKNYFWNSPNSQVVSSSLPSIPSKILVFSSQFKLSVAPSIPSKNTVFLSLPSCQL